MKILFLLVITALLYSCTDDKKTPPDPNQLVYHISDAKTETLSTETELNGDTARKILTSKLKLENTGENELTVQDISLKTTEGAHTAPVNSFSPFVLKPGKDTTLNLKFDPFNDVRLYRITGLRGSFKPAYELTLSYKISGSDKLLAIIQKAIADKIGYQAYNKHTATITGYSFDTGNHFDRKQKEYLATLPVINQPPFVFLSEQEIAASGLNFRFKNFYRQDTLYAELAIVNHAGFQVMIVPDKLDIVPENGTDDKTTAIVTTEKVSGTQQHPDMIEKGDRVLIHFKKSLKLKAPGKDRLQFNITGAFILKGNKALFGQNIRLMPQRF